MSNHLLLTATHWQQIWPNAPEAVISAFTLKQKVLEVAGILQTRTRLAYFCANIEHECAGFTIKNLTENIMYTASRMAQVWPSRFSSASAVVARYGSAAGWQMKAFDDIYGNRMGNRPGTHDGSTYIGRGGPQWTGRDGYAALARIAGIDAVNDPILASNFSIQPEVCAAFWQWKNLNRFADAGDFTGAVKAWNGGTNGMADRRAQMAGNDPVIQRLATAADVVDVVNDISSPSIVAASHPIGDVRWIQESLNALDKAGVIHLPARLETTTGIYGQKTRNAVEIFQTKFNIAPFDGIAGKLTVPRIQEELSKVAIPRGGGA